jgi:hypothetical protein
VKAKRVLLNSVKDPLIPHISEKMTPKDMYDALLGLYQTGNLGRKLILKHQLQATEMFSSNTVASYLMRITQIRDQLAGIGETVDDVELVNVALSGLPSLGNHLCRGSVHKRSCQILTDYGSIASRRRIG